MDSGKKKNGLHESGPEKQKRELGWFSGAVQKKKESMYDRIHVSVKTMDTVIWIVSGLLAVVVILIILEATGVFKL